MVCLSPFKEAAPWWPRGSQMVPGQALTLAKVAGRRARGRGLPTLSATGVCIL